MKNFFNHRLELSVSKESSAQLMVDARNNSNFFTAESAHKICSEMFVRKFFLKQSIKLQELVRVLAANAT